MLNKDKTSILEFKLRNTHDPIIVDSTEVTMFLGHKLIKDEKVNSQQLNICSYCISQWRASAIGNASKYTKFFYFSRDTGLIFREIIPGNRSSFVQSGFDVRKNTKVLIHGWLDGGLINFAAEARDEYLSAEDVNILSVEWSPVAALWFYPVVRAAVEPVGIYVAHLLDWLVSELGVPLGSIHIIGNSLGAHIAGVASEQLINGTLNRITGLDPAAPGFGSSTTGRLDSSDAQFVDVIHTAGLWVGWYSPCGSADFYPNGGFPNQPGCPIDCGECSHCRASKFFVESITSKRFVANVCDSWSHYKEGRCENSTTAVMGEHVDLSIRGSFYLHTASHYPYALGKIKRQQQNTKN